MVKKRDPARKPTQTLEQFADSVEGQPPAKSWKGLDPNAPRYKAGNPNSKTLSFPMNEYEHLRLVEASKAADRTMLDFVRQAVKVAVAKELD